MQTAAVGRLLSEGRDFKFILSLSIGRPTAAVGRPLSEGCDFKFILITFER